MCNVIEIADKADMIINGYAFTKEENNVRILNLNNPDKAVIVNERDEAVETTMDDIELAIVMESYLNNKKYLEV